MQARIITLSNWKFWRRYCELNIQKQNLEKSLAELRLTEKPDTVADIPD